MGHLDVPGASLHYETAGQGPLLLLIPGANGDASIFTQLSQYLTDRFTVVTYDRRGFSRSQLLGPQNYELRLETDADDAQRLVQHLSDQPATVFGSSSGAIVALELLIRHPSVIHAVISHEAPAVNLLPDPDASKWRAFFTEVYETYRQVGIERGMQKFVAGVLSDQEAELLKERAKNANGVERSPQNIEHWYEHELRQYTSADLDVAALATSSDRLVLAGGRESHEHFPYLSNAALARKFGLNILELPGGHLGYAFHAAQFAQELSDALEKREG
ncbi:acetyltransferase/esterase [Cadophora sp. DSE1049]|nr:acetyltransferase/esterase [Cadophora sp. DSE1049]